MIRNSIASLLTIAVLAGPVAAAPFAEQSYMSGFVDHWKSTIGKQNTIVVGVLFVGALGIFIITRGKKLK
jgi:hypothetical protein